MSGDSGTSKTGATHRYYKCSIAKRRLGCKRKAVRKEWIENLVFNWVKELTMDDEVIDDLVNLLVGFQEADNVVIPLRG